MRRAYAGLGLVKSVHKADNAERMISLAEQSTRSGDRSCDGRFSTATKNALAAAIGMAHAESAGDTGLVERAQRAINAARVEVEDLSHGCIPDHDAVVATKLAATSKLREAVHLARTEEGCRDGVMLSFEAEALAHSLACLGSGDSKFRNRVVKYANVIRQACQRREEAPTSSRSGSGGGLVEDFAPHEGTSVPMEEGGPERVQTYEDQRAQARENARREWHRENPGEPLPGYLMTREEQNEAAAQRLEEERLARERAHEEMQQREEDAHRRSRIEQIELEEEAREARGEPRQPGRFEYLEIDGALGRSNRLGAAPRKTKAKALAREAAERISEHGPGSGAKWHSQEGKPLLREADEFTRIALRALNDGHCKAALETIEFAIEKYGKASVHTFSARSQAKENVLSATEQKVLNGLKHVKETIANSCLIHRVESDYGNDEDLIQRGIRRVRAYRRAGNLSSLCQNLDTNAHGDMGNQLLLRAVRRDCTQAQGGRQNYTKAVLNTIRQNLDRCFAKSAASPRYRLPPRTRIQLVALEALEEQITRLGVEEAEHRQGMTALEERLRYANLDVEDIDETAAQERVRRFHEEEEAREREEDRGRFSHIEGARRRRVQQRAPQRRRGARR